jgi:lysine-ketoglutarate reductase/saccharopine dehydrogenase-like protein (TIGR00300 family)
VQLESILEAEGHLVDSQILTSVFDAVIRHDSAFEVLSFDIGRTNEDYSRLRLKVSSPDQSRLSSLLEELLALGCHPLAEKDVTVRTADKDGCAPEDFYSTTNHRTVVRHGGRWIEVGRQRMDAVIIVEDGTATCRKLRDVRRGDPIVCGNDGIRVVPEFRERDRHGFAFMTNEISSERRVEVGVARIAAMVREIKASHGRIAVVAGPVLIHTGGSSHFQELIRSGFVDVLLAGNALAVHDVEQALFGTSLGVHLERGDIAEAGHEHHLRAINRIRRAGGIAQAVETGLLMKGIMYECVKNCVPFVLAGSIRDDGPLPEVITDTRQAQCVMRDKIEGVTMCLMIATALHSVAVGNLLPARVRVVCVDINPATVTKLTDRGSFQTVGLVTDVEPFLRVLVQELEHE